MNNEKKKKIDVRDVPKEDFFLQTLVNIVNTFPFSLSIMLNVGGFLISGELFSGKEYFEKFGTQFVSGFKELGMPKSTQEEIRKAFAEHGAVYDKKPEEIEDPAYIHLKDARFFGATGNSIPDYQGVLWRGRISEVQGFVLGSLRKEGE